MAKEPGRSFVDEGSHLRGFSSSAIRLGTFSPFSDHVTEYREGLPQSAWDFPHPLPGSFASMNRPQIERPGIVHIPHEDAASNASFPPEPHPGSPTPFSLSLRKLNMEPLSVEDREELPLGSV